MVNPLGGPRPQWSPFVAVEQHAANRAGRDFVTGDIHGSFALVNAGLRAVGFDPAVDRLFCVGDLIDRGPASADVRRFLAQPGVHAVCGNHEANLLALYLDGEDDPSDAELAPYLGGFGLHWWLGVDPAERRAILSRLAELPLAIEVATARGSVGLIHADVPAGMDWPTFVAALNRDDPQVVHTCLWGRERLRRGDDSGVPGIGRLYVGHTPQWDGVTRVGNVYALDSGAVFGLTGQMPEGRLTLAQVVTGTAALMAARPADAPPLLDIRVGQVPSTPFGAYATTD